MAVEIEQLIGVIPLADLTPEQRSVYCQVINDPKMGEVIKSELQFMYRDSLSRLGLGETDIDKSCFVLFEGPLTASALSAVYAAKRGADVCNPKTSFRT